MKKLFLGLLLTVGVSGLSFANTIENNLQDEIIENNTHIEATNANYEEAIIDCYTGYLATTIDCNGNKGTISLGGHSRSCSANEADGTMVINVNVSNPINTCQSGSVKALAPVVDLL